jgi:phosphoribosylanthranilate isomerase
VTPERAREIAHSVSGFFLRVGVFVNATEEELLNIASHVPLDVLQIHGKCALPQLSTYRVWKAIPPSARPGHDIRIDAYLLDTVTPSYGGSGKTFDWEIAAGVPYRAIIGGGLHGPNVAQAVEAARPWGVDACSRLESAAGIKDPELVREFVTAALAAGRRVSTEINL